MSLMPREKEKVFKTLSDRQEEILKRRPPTSLPNEVALEKYGRRTPNANKIIEMAHNKLLKNGSIHPSLAKVILELVPENYNTDLASEIYEYQQFLTGQWGVDKKGRAAKGTLYLKKGMTPEQYLMGFR